jgi:adenylate cyclase
MISEESVRAVENPLIGSVADWLMAQALAECEVEGLFGGCCNRLRAAGIPLWRAYLTFRTLHPLFRAISLTWRQEGGLESVGHLHTDISAAWRQSTLRHMMESQIPFLRRRLVGEGAVLDFPVLTELRDKGAQDYFAYLVPFGSVSPDELRTDGIAGSWSTDRASGFTEADIHSLQRIQQRLAVACKVTIKDQIARNILSAYLGADAGRQVLDGRIKRGDGETIHAVIWYSDMRNSTNMADHLLPADFLTALNSYFECTAGAVLAHDGEVLRFIGDAVLAIFPIRDSSTTASDACQLALAAVRDADGRLVQVNHERKAIKKDALSFGLGLHLGDVMYGNIGVPERVEFSVIGPAANEVARLEGMTKELNRHVLMSGEFAQHVSGDCQSLGQHKLRGVGTPLELFTLSGQ